MGCEVSTLLTSVSLPAIERRLPFHPGSHPPIIYLSKVAHQFTGVDECVGADPNIC
jgi:hypothetical protein